MMIGKMVIIAKTIAVMYIKNQTGFVSLLATLFFKELILISFLYLAINDRIWISFPLIANDCID